MSALERCVLTYPDGLDDWIDGFRREHHPRGIVARPHITLVYPFTSSLSATILHHHVVGVAVACPAFEISFGPAEVGDGGTVWLPLVGGGSQCERMHNALYAGPLSAFRSEFVHRPHLTLAEASEEEAPAIAEMARANTASSAWVRTIVIELIDRDGTIDTEGEFDLA
jgi:2'-5' RNA ligase